ncbi:hypothetical protein ACFQ08_37320, partial [Streptosporangium algeriense]
MNALLPRPVAFETSTDSFELFPGAPVSGPADLAGAVRLALSVLDLRPAGAGEAGAVMPEPGCCRTSFSGSWWTVRKNLSG